MLSVAETLSKIIVKWNKKYALGIAAMDAQHKNLFRLSDDLDTALKNGIRSEDINALLIRLELSRPCRTTSDS